MSRYSILTVYWNNSICFIVKARECDSNAIVHSTRTLSGYECQRWDSDTPHKPKSSILPKNPSFAQNFCFNLDGDSQPWCYTTNPLVRWEHCPEPICEEDDIFTSDEKYLSQILDSEKLCGISMCDKDRIIGGIDSPPCEHPWMAQIVYSKGILLLLFQINTLFRTNIFGSDKGKACLWWGSTWLVLGDYSCSLYNGRKGQLR